MRTVRAAGVSLHGQVLQQPWRPTHAHMRAHVRVGVKRRGEEEEGGTLVSCQSLSQQFTGLCQGPHAQICGPSWPCAGGGGGGGGGGGWQAASMSPDDRPYARL